MGSGPGITLGAAALAALGFALKPHFLAIPALVELLVLLGRGPWRAVRDPVPWLMAALWLAYLVAIPLAFPAYFGQVLPLIRDLYLGLGGFAWWQVLLTERLGTALMLLLPLGIVAFRPSWGRCPGAGAGGAGRHPGRGGAAQGLDLSRPAGAIFAGLLAVVLAARWLEWALPPGRLAGVAPGAAAVAAFAIGLHGFAGAEAPWREITWSWSRAGAVSALLKREAHGERLLVLSPDIFPVYPALNYAHAQSTLRTMNLWLLQGSMPNARMAATATGPATPCRAPSSSSTAPSPRISPGRRRPPFWSAATPASSLRRGIRLSRLFFPPSAVCRDTAALPSGRGDRGLPPAPARGLMTSCKLRQRR
ncbi:hypothetical protein ACFQU2_02670 [Siccirubricoccus deserti]